MYNWKSINRKIRERISIDGYEYLGANSISYDDDYSIIMYSTTANDIYVKLKSGGTNQILVCLDINTSNKNKKRFNELINTLKTNNEYKKTLVENETNEGKEIILYETNDESEEFFIKNTTHIFETCWPLLLEINQEEIKTNKQEEKEILNKEEIVIETINASNKTQQDESSKLSIRLINKELNKNGVSMLFELSDDIEHELEIIIQKENTNDIILTKAKKQLEYYVELKEAKVKFIISENKRKLYQTSLVGSIKSHLVVSNETNTKEQEDSSLDNRETIVDQKLEEITNETTTLISLDMRVDLSEISMEAMNFI